MGLLAKLLLGIIHKKTYHAADPRSKYIYYKIVNASATGEAYYTLQCINTNAIFHAKLIEIIYDIDILHGLHPIQACYIGIEYAKHLSSDQVPSVVKNSQKQKLSKYSISRYGTYTLCYQDRKGDVCFINQITHNEILMDPRDIALSEELIQEFDAAQAFYIGLLAGLKLNNPIRTPRQLPLNTKFPYLWVIK